jgi:8-oxo-dGTP pyrophosphatase MutT (NUDIX family)
VADRETIWQVLERRLLVDRTPYARIFDEDVRLPDGQVIKDFVHVELPDFVIVFACLEDGRVPFVRQYRQAVGADTLELPAGHIEDGEEALNAAQRELREEAGVEASTWQFLGKYIMDANRGCGWAYIYLAQGARLTVLPDSGDLGEMTLHLLPLDEVRRVWAAGELVSAPTALAVSLALHRLET